MIAPRPRSRSTTTITSLSPPRREKSNRQSLYGTWTGSHVVAEQASSTINRRLAARLRYARFPFRRSVSDVDFSFQPSVDQKLVEDLATLRVVEEHRPIVFLSQPGCAKMHLAVALATLAVEVGYRGYFTTGDDMVRQLLAARRDGNFAANLRTYTTPTVLVIDDVGLLPIAAEGAGVFFHVINARYENGHPTLTTTNRGLPSRGEVFGDPVVAAVLLGSCPNDLVEAHFCVVDVVDTAVTPGSEAPVGCRQHLTGG